MADATGGISPLTLMMFGMGAMSSIGGAYAQSRAIQGQGDYQSALARINSSIADFQSGTATRMGDLAASRRNLAARKQEGDIRTQMAGSGVSVESGTVKDLTTSAHTLGALDEMTIRNNAARQAWGYKVQGMQATAQGQFDELTAQSQSTQTLLTGGMQAVGDVTGGLAYYERMKNYGMGRF